REDRSQRRQGQLVVRGEPHHRGDRGVEADPAQREVGAASQVRRVSWIDERDRRSTGSGA
ncbi:hypothetical protein Llan_2604, partial [Legionella lansingensis]